ncbi:MAG: radical SAM protein [Fidelibacterota bacterium]|nr:MAG: radical SAM protein [Candidatus Neomarinimicrobiota bacterium]
MGDIILKKYTRRSFLENTAKLCFKVGLSLVFFNGFRIKASSDKTTTIANKYDHTGSGFEPAYLELHKTGELNRRAETLWAILERCQLCPRRCRVNRLKGMSGFCRAPGATLVVSSFHPHFGEERPLVGNGGSGTIFLTHCNLRCVFCQNWEISQLGRGVESDIDELADMMLRLQRIGCHNINLVTPTHYSAHILKAIDIAAGSGLRLPIVYNTSSWERLEIIQLLDGIVDIYLPDFKYWNGDMSAKYSSGAERYPEIAREVILEMHRQVGVAKPTINGIMQRGLMIRHLVMPNNAGGSEQIMEWIAENLPKDTYVNIMAQYNPVYKSFDYPEISRRITGDEYNKVVKRAKEMGLANLDIQGYWWLKR